MTDLITPDQVPIWIPGELVMDSSPQSWDGMTLKGYRYTELDVEIPLMRDYMIVVYRGAPAEMSRRCSGPWQSAQVGKGSISVLTRAEASQWRWDGPIDVSHLYMSHVALKNVACDVFERDIKDVEIRDLISTEDPVVTGLVHLLEAELQYGGIGGRLYVESLRNQACIDILRRYADISYRQDTPHGRFSPAQRRVLVDYIDHNSAENLSLEDLAGAVQLSVFYFTRKFGTEFGCSPHTYLIKRRLEHAQRLLGRRDMPLKEVAARVGFSDQSHMTRLFRRFLGVTPAGFRRDLP